MKSTRKLILKALLQTLDYGVLRLGEPTQRETEDPMNKINLCYFIFLFIPKASPKELTKIPFIKISLFALFFFFLGLRVLHNLNIWFFLIEKM